jgi:hypothetical protein
MATHKLEAMRRSLPIVLSVAVAGAYLLAVSLAGGPTGSTPSTSVFAGSTTTAVPTTTTVIENTSRSLAVVTEYWTALNEADPLRASQLVSSQRPSWEAELGFAEYTTALRRAFATGCSLAAEGIDDVVICDVAAAGSDETMPERFVVRDGKITRIDRSDIAMLSDAVLVRLARTTVPEAFDAACVDTSGRWYRPNGVTYNAECGRLLATVSPDIGWFDPAQVGLWLLTGGP